MSARLHDGVESCSRADVQTCIARYGSAGVRYAPPRRYYGAAQQRDHRNPGAPARGAGDPAARVRYLSLPRPIGVQPLRRDRGRRASRRDGASHPHDGHVPWRRSPGALQSRRAQHHEPRPPVSADRRRVALTDLELVSTGRPSTGGGDLPVRAGHQRARANDRDLSGTLERCLEPLDAAARAGARPRQGTCPVASETRFWSPVAHRTPVESAQTTCISRASGNARSHPNAKNAAAQAFAVRPSSANTVTERAAPCRALRWDCVLSEPPCRSTTARVRSVLSGSGMPTARCVGRSAGPTQEYWPPTSSSALSTLVRSASAARSSAYPGAMLSGTSATPVRRRISRRTESIAGIDVRRCISESMRSTESYAAASARATRVLSVPQPAADIIVPIVGQTRATAGRASTRHAARPRHSKRLILKMDC